MKRGKFYGIGVGPGDPELITLKAVKILQKVDVVIAPISKKESIAQKIAQPHINGEILNLKFPMVKDSNVLESFWDKNAERIKELLLEGKDVAFITIGDPMIYSTYIYILERLRGFDMETIPGIPSFCAAAAKLNIPIATGSESFVVVPTAEPEVIEDILGNFDNVVLMKVSKDFDLISKKLDEGGFSAGFVSRCCQDNEKISYNLQELKEDKIDYLSLIIGKKVKK